MPEIFPSSDEMAEAAAQAIVSELDAAIAARGRASLVATGGRSPGPIYDRMRQAPIDWSRVTVTLSDERFVPPTAPESNAGLLQRRLFQGLAARAAFAPLWFDTPTVEACADAAEPGLSALPPFDVVMLGMGEDGHVASLLPGSPVLAATMDPQGGRFVMSVPAGVGSPPVARITLTLWALLQSRAIFLLIAGETKREVIARALAGEDLPVRAILVQDRVPVRILWAPNHGA